MKSKNTSSIKKGTDSVPIFLLEGVEFFLASVPEVLKLKNLGYSKIKDYIDFFNLLTKNKRVC